MAEGSTTSLVRAAVRGVLLLKGGFTFSEAAPGAVLLSILWMVGTAIAASTKKNVPVFGR